MTFNQNNYFLGSLCFNNDILVRKNFNNLKAILFSQLYPITSPACLYE